MSYIPPSSTPENDFANSEIGEAPDLFYLRRAYRHYATTFGGRTPEEADEEYTKAVRADRARIWRQAYELGIGDMQTSYEVFGGIPEPDRQNPYEEN